MGIESNKEALAMMRNILGSIENRFREAYNKGYHDGLKAGIEQATQKFVSRLLEEAEADMRAEPRKSIPVNKWIPVEEYIIEAEGEMRIERFRIVPRRESQAEDDAFVDIKPRSTEKHTEDL